MIEPREAVGVGTGLVVVVDVAGGSVVGVVSPPDVAGVAVLAVDDALAEGSRRIARMSDAGFGAHHQMSFLERLITALLMVATVGALVACIRHDIGQTALSFHS